MDKVPERSSGQASFSNDDYERRIIAVFTKIFADETPVVELKRLLASITQGDISYFLSISGNRSLFHRVYWGDKRIIEAKLRCLFNEAERLHLSPNIQMAYGTGQFSWKNTPLHLYLANERFNIAQTFLNLAEEFHLPIDLNLEDEEGKTPLLFAVKLGNAPLELIQDLLSPENYNKPDYTGVTPAMMACAMRRVDILQLLLQYHAKQRGLEGLDFNHLSAEQKEVISDFINQQDTIKEKSLVHFAIMRSGTEKELLEKPVDYQQTVMNIAKSVGIDARRDRNAKTNSPLNDTGSPIILSAEEIKFYHKIKGQLTVAHLAAQGLGNNPRHLDLVFTQLTYYNDQLLETALLASRRNAFVLNSKTLGENAHLYTQVPDQIRSYADVSYVQSILERTESMLEFLEKIGCDFSLKQREGDKTPVNYVKILMKPGNEYSVTEDDRRYLFPLAKKLEKLYEQYTVRCQLDRCTYVTP